MEVFTSIYAQTICTFAPPRRTRQSHTRSHFLLAQVHHWSEGGGVCMTTLQAGVVVAQREEQMSGLAVLGTDISQARLKLLPSVIM